MVDAQRGSRSLVRLPFVVLGGLIVALIAFRASLSRDVFWITDAGNKFIVAQNIARGGAAAIAYPARAIDPEERWFPTGSEHFVPRNGSHYSIVAPQFPALSAPLFRACGFPGLFLIPLLGGVACALLAMLLARRLDVARWEWVGVITLAATPICFYSITFWEHTAAAALATSAVLLLLRARTASMFLTGLALAASTALREEGYVALIAVLIALLSSRRARAAFHVAIGFGVGIAPLLVLQARFFGNPFGLHLAAHSGSEPPVAMLTRVAHNLAYFLFQLHERPLVAFGLAVLPFIAVVLLILRGRVPRWMLFGAIGSSASGIALVLLSPDPMMNTANTQGLLLFLPLLLFAFWGEVDDAAPHERVLLRRAVLAYVLLMPIVLRANWTGLIWGPRYFITILPCAVVAAMSGVDRARASLRRSADACLIAAILLSVLLSLHGFVLLERKLNASHQLLEVSRALPRVLVTDVFWYPEEMASLFFEKQILMPRDEREFAALMTALHRRGVRDFAFVESDRFYWYSPRIRRFLDRFTTRQLRVQTAAVPYLTLSVRECRLP